MTVADLLEILKDYTLDAEVWFDGGDHIIAPVSHVEMRSDLAGQFALIR